MKRQEYFDIAKGIGMLCIIAGHLGVHQNVRLVYPFHVPLFFIISGYFLNNNKGIKTLLLERCKKLFTPYVITILIEIIFSGMYIILRTQEGIPGLMSMVLNKVISGVFASGMENPVLNGVESVGAIWFLPALFFSIAITMLLLRTGHAHVYAIAVFLIGSFISKFVWLPLGISVGLCGSGFMYAGWIAKKKNFFQNTYLPILAVIVYVIEVMFNLFVTVARNSYPYYLTALGAIIISYGVIIMSKKIEKVKYISDFLCFIGRNSLIVLCVHAIELRYFPWGKLGLPIWMMYVCKVATISGATFFIGKATSGMKHKNHANN